MDKADRAPLAVITAGGRRLGKMFALHLARRGYDIAVHYHTSQSDAEQTAQEVQALGRRCMLFAADLTSYAQVKELLPRIYAEMAVAPELLVNNASTFVANTLQDTTLQQFDSDFGVHVKAPFFLIQSLAALTTGGQVVNIIDAGVTSTVSGHFSYLLSKKTLLDLTAMAARALAPTIRVNAIAPGLILPTADMEAQTFERLSTANLLQRATTPFDVLTALDYLLDARQVTGECLFVDGGDHLM